MCLWCIKKSVKSATGITKNADFFFQKMKKKKKKKKTTFFVQKIFGKAKIESLS